MQTLKILLLLAVLIPLTFAGWSAGSGGGNQKHHKPSSQTQIKGGIGDGYIYPAKSKHQRKGGSGGQSAKTYKLIIQNAGSQGGPSQHHAPQHHQAAQVKTFKVIHESAPAPAAAVHGGSVKTIKLIHVNGGGGDCPSKSQGWQ